jgi:hypothetical protein
MKIGFCSNTIPMLNLMVVVMAFCAVGASIRRSHLWWCICRRAEKWVGDICVNFWHWMHIGWLAFGVGCRYIFRNFKLLACPFPISIKSTIFLCMGIKIHFTPASHFYTTKNCMCFYTHFVLLTSTFDCELSRMPVIFI